MLIGSLQLPVRWDSVVQYLQTQDFSVALHLCSLAGLAKQDIPMVLPRHHQPYSKRCLSLTLSTGNSSCPSPQYSLIPTCSSSQIPSPALLAICHCCLHQCLCVCSHLLLHRHKQMVQLLAWGFPLFTPTSCH